MLVIRYFRISKKNQPSFKLVVTDKRKSSVKGRYVEEVGFVDPLKDKKFLRAERIKYWISVGAKPSPTVYNLLISEKIIEGKKINKFKKSRKKEPARSATPSVAGGEKKTEAPVIAAAAAAPAEPVVKEVKKAKEEKVPETPKASEAKPKEPKSETSKPTETPEKKSETK